MERQKLAPSDPEASAANQFGTSVALSSDGKVAMIGRPRHGSDDTGGTVYVFVLEGSKWREQQKLAASGAEPGGGFGSSVALSSNNNVMLVGAPSFPGGNGGKVYVFVRKGNTWVERQKLTSLDTEASDDFGAAVAISANGNVGLIGAPFNDNVGFDNGAAYVFVRRGNGWVHRIKFIAKGFVGFGEYFGSSVALTADGNRALVGAPGFISDISFPYAGAAFVFVHEGNTWKKQQKLATSAGKSLGGSVVLSDNGDRALIRGADKKAYVFVRKGVTWAGRYTLTPSDGSPFGGGSVALSAKGKVSLVGAPEANCPGIIDCGAAYVFRP